MHPKFQREELNGFLILPIQAIGKLKAISFYGNVLFLACSSIRYAFPRVVKAHEKRECDGIRCSHSGIRKSEEKNSKKSRSNGYKSFLVFW